MRNKSSHKSEMINQILFGESFKILKQEKNWVYIKLSHDNYTGWICNKQYQKISKRKIESYTLNQKNYSIKIKGDRQQIVLGSFLPTDELFKKKLQLEFNLNYYKSKNSSLSLPKIAKKYLNSPYLWGGRTNLGIDCSGFTQIVYRFFSINLPRDSHQQAKKGELIKFKNCKSGDLAFFEEKNKINHVGIVLPRNNIIHSSGKVRIDQFDNKGIFNSENKKYSHKLKLIKRVTL